MIRFFFKKDCYSVISDSVKKRKKKDKTKKRIGISKMDGTVM